MTTQANQIGSVILNYTGNVRVAARRCVPLALRLAQTAPSDLSTEERERLAAVRRGASRSTRS